MCEVKTAHELWGVKMVVKARRAKVMLTVMLLDQEAVFVMLRSDTGARPVLNLI